MNKHSKNPKKVTLRLPSELYVSLLKLILNKHRGIYGHLNKECIKALEDHILKGSSSIADSFQKKLMSLSKESKEELKDLYMLHDELVERKYKIAERYIAALVIDEFLREYDKLRETEIAFEKRISAFGEKYGFRYTDLLNIRVQMVRNRFNAYISRRIGAK